MLKSSATAQPTHAKITLQRAMNALFHDFDEEEMRALYTEEYIQHNPHVPTGLDAVIELLPALKEAGFDCTTYRVLEDGDLLLTHTTYRNAAVFGADEVVAFDPWHMEDGKVTEHWDAIIPVHAEKASGRNQTDGMTDVVDLDRTAENKALVESFVRTVLMDQQTDKMDDYIRDGIYDKHNPVVGDGPDALKAVLGEIKNNTLHRVIGEGNFVLTQAEGTWGEKPIAIYDLCHVEDGKIAEHWDVLQEIPADMAHEIGMF